MPSMRFLHPPACRSLNEEVTESVCENIYFATTGNVVWCDKVMALKQPVLCQHACKPHLKPCRNFEALPKIVTFRESKEWFPIVVRVVRNDTLQEGKLRNGLDVNHT